MDFAMSADQPTSSSLGEATPESAKFPQSLSIPETPKLSYRSCDDSYGWTPRFAEEYSVFNSTPGNLRGTSGLFHASYQSSTGHKRLLSSESVAIELASHAGRLSPTSTLTFQPVGPSRCVPSSPAVAHPLLGPGEAQNQRVSQQRSGKKARGGTLIGQSPQTATPPPSSHKGTRRLAPKPQAGRMQPEEFESDFVASATQQQQQLLGAFSAPLDMFGVSLTSTTVASGFDDGQAFWDPGVGGMDIDFSIPIANSFPNTGHRPMDSLDWGKTNEMFQPTNVVPLQNQSQNQSQENNPPQKKERLIAPKPAAMPSVDTSLTDALVYSQSIHTSAADSFVTLNPTGSVNPGLLLTRPLSSNMDLAAFDSTARPLGMDSLPSTQPVLAPATERKRGQVRRSASAREVCKAQIDQKPPLTSPVKPAIRPGLLRSASESRGRKPMNRPGTIRSGSMSNPVPTVRNGPQTCINRSAPQGSRTNGRTSPLKTHQRLSSLSSIPEHSGPGTRTSVRFTIDSRGRARAETTVIVDEEDQGTPAGRRRRREERRQNWESSEDESSSTDDEPIIIPSRNSSFALPEPSRPAYSRPSHMKQRSLSDQGTCNLGIYYMDHSSPRSDNESEAETVVDVSVAGNRRGDALSELRKVREDRQKRMPPLITHNFSSDGPSSASSTISPASTVERTFPTPSRNRGNQIRCVCNTTLSQINGDGYMVQCESCEMWLHGRCVKITRQTLPRVYVCAFCANTPNAHGARGRGMRRTDGEPSLRNPSPLAHKSVRSFR
ncbi:hypothetical protein F5Y17DRAFT_417256 [Xylariaceae sp. FL0594]|nr:hypothetical protein F5Y17DRAFT_417256 [Xylariaceae sp. FL0594]